MLLIGTAGMLLYAAVLFAIGTILWQELPVNFSAQDQSASQTTLSVLTIIHRGGEAELGSLVPRPI